MIKARTSTRLAAIQAIFQIRANNDNPSKVIKEFCNYRFDANLRYLEKEKIDIRFFEEIVVGSYEKRIIIDDIIVSGLTSDWKLERLDPTMHALLKLGIYELKFLISTPPNIIIDEYVSISSFFFNKIEVGFVNGFLDKVSKKVRMI